MTLEKKTAPEGNLTFMHVVMDILKGWFDSDPKLLICRKLG
jgi:hypothetical protein